jgi:hypothetical protein
LQHAGPAQSAQPPHHRRAGAGTPVPSTTNEWKLQALTRSDHGYEKYYDPKLNGVDWKAAP